MNSMDSKKNNQIVVVNAEEQYSIWPTWRKIPAGWQPVGEGRPREECLAWIEENWVDMRPRSMKTATKA